MSARKWKVLEGKALELRQRLFNALFEQPEPFELTLVIQSSDGIGSSTEITALVTDIWAASDLTGSRYTGIFFNATVADCPALTKNSDPDFVVEVQVGFMNNATSGDLEIKSIK